MPRVPPRTMAFFPLRPRSIVGSFLLVAGTIAASGVTQKPQHRHCEKRSDEAIQTVAAERFLDCFATLAMTLREAGLSLRRRAYRRAAGRAVQEGQRGVGA